MPADGHTSLYRYFGQNDELLYIGITSATPVRFAQHAHNAPWHHEVVRTAICHFETRQAALHAEKMAIMAERPKYNVQHNGGNVGAKPGKLLRVDSKDRVSLGKYATHNLYEITRGDNGALILTPMAFVPTVLLG